MMRWTWSLSYCKKFRRQVRDGKYDYLVFAHNGLEALTKLIEEPDNLPGPLRHQHARDGWVTLLTKLKELKNPLLKTVIVSGLW
jgi:hypothetical protein